MGRTRKKFSVCTLETLFAKREAGCTRHYVFYIQSVEKGVKILRPRPKKHAAWLAAIYFTTILLILVTQNIALIGFNFIDNEIISVKQAIFCGGNLVLRNVKL